MVFFSLLSLVGHDDVSYPADGTCGFFTNGKFSSGISRISVRAILPSFILHRLSGNKGFRSSSLERVRRACTVVCSAADLVRGGIPNPKQVSLVDADRLKMNVVVRCNFAFVMDSNYLLVLSVRYIYVLSGKVGRE